MVIVLVLYFVRSVAGHVTAVKFIRLMVGCLSVVIRVRSLSSGSHGLSVVHRIEQHTPV